MRRLARSWLTIATHLGALLPLVLLLWDATHDGLTANPIQAITFRTGYPALVLLVLALACTPVSALSGVKRLLALRRPLGLYAYGYACLHLLTFVGLDYGFDGHLIVDALAEKRFVLVGLGAFLLLTPLAITSTRGWMRRLGRRWKRLHRLVYLAAPLAVLHFLWLVKADIREPLLFGAIVTILLALRLPAVRGRLLGIRLQSAPLRWGRLRSRPTAE